MKSRILVELSAGLRRGPHTGKSPMKASESLKISWRQIDMLKKQAETDSKARPELREEDSEKLSKRISRGYC